MSLQSTNRLSEGARIEIIIPPDISLQSWCDTEVLTTVSMQTDIYCEIDLRDNKIILSELFYSFGYDPQLEKTIAFRINDAIVRNPRSLIEDLSFTARTLEIN